MRLSLAISLTVLAQIFSVAIHGATGTKHTFDLTTSETQVEFLAVGRPSAIKIRGKTNAEKVPSPLQGKLQIQDQAVNGNVKYKLDALDTGIDLRDRHMKEKYLETQKFPEASLVLTKLQLPAGFASGNVAAENLPFEAEQTLHGTKKTIKGKVAMKREKENVQMNFEYPLQVRDFGIETPSYLGIKVTDEVSVFVHLKGKLTP